MAASRRSRASHGRRPPTTSIVQNFFYNHSYAAKAIAVIAAVIAHSL
jgi:hypothetical protein